MKVEETFVLWYDIVWMGVVVTKFNGQIGAGEAGVWVYVTSDVFHELVRTPGVISSQDCEDVRSGSLSLATA
jgi:hypothetical protein